MPKYFSAKYKKICHHKLKFPKIFFRAFQSQRAFLQVFGKSVWDFEKWTKINVHF